MDAASFRIEEVGTDLLSAQFKSLYLRWYNGTLVPMNGTLHIWKGTTNADRDMQVLEQLMLRFR